MPLLFKLAWREWRAGELLVLVLALGLAVAASTAVGLFSDRLDRAMLRQAGDLLAADLAVESPREIPADVAALVNNAGLQTAKTLVFPSVIFAATGEGSSLGAIKAVSEGYPLRGALQLADDVGAAASASDSLPEPGEVWVDPVLLANIGLAVGDSVAVGAIELRIAAVLKYEPDRSGSFVALAPRLMMNLSDVPATELVAEGSRVSWRLLVAGGAEQIEALVPVLETTLTDQQRLLTPAAARPQIGRVLERATRFLRLATLITILLAAIAVLIAGREYVVRRADAVALLKTLGASGRKVLALYGGILLLAGLLSFMLGAVLGYLGHAAIANALQGVIPQALPAPRWQGVAGGLLTLAVLLPACTLPLLDALRRVAPVRVLRGTGLPITPRAAMFWLFGVTAATVLLWWTVGDWQLGLYLLLGLLLASLLFWLLGRLLQGFAGMLANRLGMPWKLGVLRLARSGTSLTTLVSLMAGLGLLLLLSILGNDVLESWERSLPEQTPNVFAINVQRDQQAALAQWLEDKDIVGAQGATPVFYPMVRARLVNIAGKPVSEIAFSSERAERNALRDFNLSWQAEMNADNAIVDGRWWTPEEHGQPLISMEVEYAERLGISVGDTLEFNIAGDPLIVTVQSTRTVDWDSMQGNFFVLFPPGVIDEYPLTLFTALYIDASQQALVPALMQRFPGVAALDVAAIVTQIRTIIDQLVAALRLIFAFTLIAGLIVLLAGLQATTSERRREVALLRSLGASKRSLALGGLYEFLMLAVLAALPAVLFGYGLAAVLARVILEVDWAIGSGGLGLLLVCTAVITLTGWLAVRRSIDTPPMLLLRG